MPTGQRNNLAYQAERRRKGQVMADELVGSSCFFCGGRNQLVLHRKDGLPHKQFHRMGKAEHEEHLRSGDYVRLCRPCHRGVHWALEHLCLTWEQVMGLMPSG